MPQAPEAKDAVQSKSSAASTLTEPAGSRVDAALAEYMERSEQGETVAREEFLEKYDDIRSELTAFFRMADLAAKRAVTGPAKAPANKPAASATSPGAIIANPSATKGGAAVAKTKAATAAKAEVAKSGGPKNAAAKAAGKGTGGKADESSQPRRPRDRVERVRDKVGWGPWIQDRFRETPGAAVSAVIHLLVLLLLGLMSLPLPEFDQLSIPILVQEVDAEEPAVEPIAEIVPQEETEAEDTEVVEALTQVSETMDISSLNDAPAPGLRTELSDFSKMHTMSLDALVGSSAKKGTGLGAGGMGKVKFFGQSTAGQRFVFVIDNSNSMHKGKFETALHELELAVGQMTPNQLFYVVFFSDTAYPLFHPQSAETFVPATPGNKDKLHEWLYHVEMCLHTNALKAVQKAISLNPDVIYLLGDGAFTDKTGEFLMGLPGGPQIHVCGMEVKDKDAAGFKAISDKFQGTYKDVGIHPEQAKEAEARPRPRNNKRGPVWGLELK